MLYIVSGIKRRELIHFFGIVLGLLCVLTFLGIFFHNHTVETDTDNCLYCNIIRAFQTIVVVSCIALSLPPYFCFVLLPQSLALSKLIFRHSLSRGPPQ